MLQPTCNWTIQSGEVPWNKHTCAPKRRVSPRPVHLSKHFVKVPTRQKYISIVDNKKSLKSYKISSTNVRTDRTRNPWKGDAVDAKCICAFRYVRMRAYIESTMTIVKETTPHSINRKEDEPAAATKDRLLGILSECLIGVSVKKYPWFYDGFDTFSSSSNSVYTRNTDSFEDLRWGCIWFLHTRHALDPMWWDHILAELRVNATN